MFELGLFDLGSERNVSFYVGAGASLNGLAGVGFSPFGKVGLKLRPVGVTFPVRGRIIDAQFNLRMYADRYTREDFGLPALPGPKDRSREWVYGPSVGVGW
jgi:hypothetical protein